MGTAIQGLKRGFNQSISALGSDVLYLERRDWFINSRWIRQNRRREITWDQVRGLQRQITSARAAPHGEHRAPGEMQEPQLIVGHGHRNDRSGPLHGGTTRCQGTVLDGRQAEGGVRCACSGRRPPRTCFGGESPVGARVHVGGYPFEVVRVLEPRNSWARSVWTTR